MPGKPPRPRGACPQVAVLVTLQLCLAGETFMPTASVDFLTVYQDFPAGSLPIFGSDWVLVLDNQGELKQEFIKHYQHEGSHSSKISVRSDGNRLSISGNPSKYNRLDNVFGCPDVSAALAVYNGILPELGLPQLYTRTWDESRSHQLQCSDDVLIERPVLTRVDVCQNYALGSHSRSFLRWVEGQSYNGKGGHMYSNGATVDFNRNSRYLYFKYYLKAVELCLHRRKAKSAEDRDYLDKLIGWAEHNGIVRFEVSLKAMKLKRAGLDNPANWKGETMGKIIEAHAPHWRLQENDRARSHPLDGLYGELVDAGYTDGFAKRAVMIAGAWLGGAAIKTQMSRATYYKYRRALMHTGIDIANPCSAKMMLPRTFDLHIEVASPPSFYKTAFS